MTNGTKSYGYDIMIINYILRSMYSLCLLGYWLLYESYFVPLYVAQRNYCF